jgi:hypothetical protein
MNRLYPKFSIGQLPCMLRIALLGVIVAGPYGALHDQISFAISPEYFTKVKFKQFSYADFGWPPRLFAAEVGFLATWWVGLFAGWIVARAGLAELPAPARPKLVFKAFAIVLITTMLAGVVGALLGVEATRRSDLSSWSDLQRALEIKDLRAFVIVAYLHAAGYLGALFGLVLAVVYVRRCLRVRMRHCAQTF